MTSNPPAQEPEEQRWQQPSFQPDPRTFRSAPGAFPSEPNTFQPEPDTFPSEPDAFQAPVTGPVVPAAGAPVPPPSSFEAVIGALAKLVWPVAILMIIFTKLSFWPVLIAAIVIGAILSALKANLKQRRHSAGGDLRTP